VQANILVTCARISLRRESTFPWRHKHTAVREIISATPADGLDFGCVLYRLLSIDFVKYNGQERETHSV
jgi:hypothetical protein